MLLTPLKRPRVTPLPSQDAPLVQDQELRIKDRTPPTTPPLPPPRQTDVRFFQTTFLQIGRRRITAVLCHFPGGITLLISSTADFTGK